MHTPEQLDKIVGDIINDITLQRDGFEERTAVAMIAIINTFVKAQVRQMHALERIAERIEAMPHIE